MNRLIESIRPSTASLVRALGLMLILLALDARAGNYCNNPVPPCDPNDQTSWCYRPADPPAKCEPLSCGKCTKSPCYVGSGVYTTRQTDLAIRTAGVPIVVSRMYQSSRTIDGESGYGWVSSLSARLYYAVYLKAEPNSFRGDDVEAHVRLPNGSIYRFVENLDGTYTPPAGRFDTLVRNADFTWDLRPQRTRSRLHFSATGQLLQIIDDFGNTTEWTYVNDRLARIEDMAGSGRAIDITWGADGRISDVTDMTGRNVHYSYSGGALDSVTNPIGQTTDYGSTPGKYVPLLTSITDHWGRTLTAVAFDARDRVTSYTDRGETFSYSYIGGITSKNDSSGNTWQFPYADGGLVTESRPPGGGTPERTTYDPNGLVQMQTDAAGVKAYSTYDGRGNTLTMIADYQGPTAVEWRTVYDTQFPDQPASIKPHDPATGAIHPHWQGVRYDYHPPGSNAPGALHHSYKLDDDGSTSHLISTLTYDTHGRIVSHANETGALTTLTYDGQGNLERVEYPSNNAAGIKPVHTYGYDSLGRVLTATDPNGHTTTYTWDALDRVTSVTLPAPSPSSTLAFVTTYHHDEFDSATGLLFVRTEDANHRSTRMGYNQFGQAGQSIDQAGKIIGYTYSKGLLASQIDPNNNVTTYEYDAQRRPWKVTFPDGTSEVLTYHADGNVASKRDRLNRLVTFAYDRHKRVSSKGYPNGGSYTQTYQGEKLISVVDTLSSPAETHLFTYDSSFRVISDVQGPRGTVSYTYGVADRPATMSVAGGNTETYGYYPDGSLRTIEWSAVPGSFLYEYSLAGQVQTVTFPNGQTRQRTYDRQDRTTLVRNTHPTTGVLAEFSYGYDVDPFTGQANMLGVRTSVTATVPALGLSGAVTNLGYDSRYQLVRADYPATAPYNGLSATWSYDGAGNRTSASANGAVDSYVYRKFGGNPLNSPQLESDGSNAYVYDGEGNITARSGTRGNFTFSWDYENRLAAVGGGLAASYRYDYDGRRTGKTVNGVSTAYLYASQQLLAESGAAGAAYLYGAGIDQPLAMLRNGQVSYYAVDGTDSVVALSNASGSIQNSYAWDLFGSSLAATETVTNPLGYTARVMADAGLHYYRARYYEPAVGRFASEDPLQEVTPLAGGEIYGYVRNSPVMFSDPMGLKCYDFVSRGSWDLIKSEPGERWLELIEGPDGTSVRRVRRIAFGVGNYTCYWRLWQRFTDHYERTNKTTTICLCPPDFYESLSRQTKTEESRKLIGAKKEVTFTPCATSPPEYRPGWNATKKGLADYLGELFE